MKTRRVTKICTISISFWLILLSLACGTGETISVVKANKSGNNTPEPVSDVTTKPRKTAPDYVDVPQLANKTSAEFDAVFGNPTEITPVRNDPKMMPGEYRLYNVKGHPKGLSVRFYKDRAKRFNLLLGKSEKSSGAAILNVFKINVGSTAPDKKSEPLSEKWRGKFNGLDFLTVYAKREKPNSGFTMIHAEISNL